jgi:hypothetical protein
MTPCCPEIHELFSFVCSNAHSLPGIFNVIDNWKAILTVTAILAKKELIACTFTNKGLKQKEVLMIKQY